MLNKLSGIYIIRCRFTNKVYIGLTVNFHYRHLCHKRDLEHNRHSNQYLQNHYNKYNTGKFESVFETFLIEEINNKVSLAIREKYYINYYNSHVRNCGFNLTLGGEYGSGTSIKKSVIQRNKALNVYVYKLNGEYIGEFNSVPDTAEFLNLNKNSVMNALQRNIQLKGFLFFRKQQSNIKYYPGRTHARKIYVYDKSFNIIKTFPSMIECSNELNISNNSINTSCNRLQLYNKLYYFVRDNSIEKFKLKYDLS